VLDAPPLADQPGAADRPIATAFRELAVQPRLFLGDQPIELRLGARRQPAVRQLLNSIRETLDAGSPG
jgi:hypothetical protein